MIFSRRQAGNNIAMDFKKSLTNQFSLSLHKNTFIATQYPMDKLLKLWQVNAPTYSNWYDKFEVLSFNSQGATFLNFIRSDLYPSFFWYNNFFTPLSLFKMMVISHRGAEDWVGTFQRLTQTSVSFHATTNHSKTASWRRGCLIRRM